MLLPSPVVKEKFNTKNKNKKNLTINTTMGKESVVESLEKLGINFEKRQGHII